MSFLRSGKLESISLQNSMRQTYKCFHLNETLKLMDLLHKFVRRKTGDSFSITENDDGILFFSYSIMVGGKDIMSGGESEEIYTFSMDREQFLKELGSPVKLTETFTTIREIILLLDVYREKEGVE